MMTQYEHDAWLRATAIAIVGHRGSGKTSLACSILDRITDRPIYVYQHPKPDLLAERGWRMMHRLEQMEDLDNAVLWLDEPQITMPVMDKRANDGLMRLLSIARHRDITMLISTCETRWITRGLESYIDAWCVKDVDPNLVKQGSLVKKIVQRHVIVDLSGFRLEKDEYLFYGRDYVGMDGKKTFVMPEFFDQRWSKPYALTEQKKCEESATESPTLVRLDG